MQGAGARAHAQVQGPQGYCLAEHKATESIASLMQTTFVTELGLPVQILSVQTRKGVQLHETRRCLPLCRLILPRDLAHACILSFPNDAMVVGISDCTRYLRS